MTITEFLEARIAEDEADLKRWGGVSGPPDWAKEDYNFGGTDDYQQVTMGYGRAMAECAAKRAIIELADEAESMDYQIMSEWGGGLDGIKDKFLYALAAVYKDHPDHDPAWSPNAR